MRTKGERVEQVERPGTTLARRGDGVLSTDTEGRITHLNAVAESLTGWTSHEAVGQPLDAVLRLVDATTREAVESPARRALEEGVIAGLASHTVSIAKDGTERPVEGSIVPIPGKEGELVGCVLVLRDVTERHEVEAELQRREEQFRATFEQAPVGIAHVSLEGQWLRVNETLCDILGFRREELAARTFQDLTHPDDLDADLNEVARLMAGEITTYSMEKRYVRKDGSLVWATLTVSLVRTPSGRPAHFISVIQDISDRKRVEEELRASEEKYRPLFTTMDEGFCVVEMELDPAGRATDYRIEVMNPAFEKHTGMSGWWASRSGRRSRTWKRSGTRPTGGWP